MEYVDHYYRSYRPLNKDDKLYTITPEMFRSILLDKKIVPVVAYDEFEKELSGKFEGSLESLYHLSFYIYILATDIHFGLLKPTARELNDVLDEMDDISEVIFIDKKGKSVSINTNSIINKVIESIKADDNASLYEYDKLIKIEDISNNEYIQSHFAMELAYFINEYFPKFRKRGALVSPDEQKLILHILNLFKLAPTVASGSRFRQLKMYDDKIRREEHYSLLPINDNYRQLVRLSFIKWKQWKDGKINWLSVALDRMKEGDIVSFPDDL